MALISSQPVSCLGVETTTTAASETGDTCRPLPAQWLEVTNGSASPIDVTVAGDYTPVRRRVVLDNGAFPAEWLTGDEHNADFWDPIAVHNGWVTNPDPDDGPIGLETEPYNYDPENPSPGGRACAVFDFGPDFAADFEVTITWSAYRPVEATPLLHVDLDDDQAGIGMWPVWDVAPDTPGGQSQWMAGYVGGPPENFEITDLDSTSYAPVLAVNTPATITLRSDGTEVQAYVNGVAVCDPIPVPVALQGSTVHGFALDHGQTDGATPLGSGGTRPPNLPSCRAVIDLVKTGGGDHVIAVPAGATRLIGPLDQPRVDRSSGAVSWTYSAHEDVAVAVVHIDPDGASVTP